MGENKIDIIDELVQEHVFIEQVMSGIRSFLFQDLTFTSDQIDTLVFIPKFFDLFVEKIHHGKEEEILFPALAEVEILKQGGPKCVLFMGLRIEHQFGEKVLSQAKSLNIPPPQLRAFVKNQIDLTTPLSIPLSEHITGYYSISLMQHFANEIQNGNTSAYLDFKSCALRHLEMLHYHIRKEDECLFIRARQLLSEDTIDEITKKCNQSIFLPPEQTQQLEHKAKEYFL